MSSIIKLLVVVGVLMWMQDRDREQALEHAAEMEANAPVMDMSMPI